MSSALISAQHVSKTYKVFAQPWDRLRELLTGRARHQEFHALADISFEIGRGESLGVVGENGAGKSTLLKILSGVTRPSAGDVRVEGRVASLLELGMGFHPELTGRRNIQLTAAMMGFSEREVATKATEIIEFSELGEFIDQPVKTYSTGMAMRLGFAIAAQVEPEILIIDEALSVGDGYFQKKCMDRIRHYLQNGGTLIFCTHAMYYLSSFCQRALWLRNGRAVAMGPVDEVVPAYEEFLNAKQPAARELNPAYEEKEVERQPARIRGVSFPNRRIGEAMFSFGEPWEVEVEWQVDSTQVATHVAIGINRTADNLEIAAFGTHREGLPAFRGERRYKARLEIPRLPLVKGEITLYVYLLDEVGLHVYDQETIPAAFSVKSDVYRFGVVHIDHRWQAIEMGSLPTAELEKAMA